MTPKVLCVPEFTTREHAQLDEAAKRLNLPLEDVVRRAVAFFSAKCVPTQRKSGRMTR